MSHAAFLFIIIIGIPIVLVGAGFFLLTLKAFRGGDARADKAQTLELARQLERTLGAMETRLIALEDIILSSQPASGEDKNERN